jgi:hypothetical protein
MYVKSQLGALTPQSHYPLQEKHSVRHVCVCVGLGMTDVHNFYSSRVAA